MQAYVKPETLDQALAHLSQHAYRVLAGGTDVYPGASQSLAGPILDIAGLPALRGMSFAEDGLRIGACTTWAEIAETSLPPACHALQQAARQVGGRQIQNVGTIGGNLCNASPAADGVPPLLALDAEVELSSLDGVRRLPLSQFLTGPRQTQRKGDELLTALCIPADALRGTSSFEKLGARAHLVISIAMVAARVELDAGRIAAVALAVGSCSAVAQRLSALETRLNGLPLDEAVRAIEDQDFSLSLAPIDDVRGTAAYRFVAAKELVLRAFNAAANGGRA